MFAMRLAALTAIFGLALPSICLAQEPEEPVLPGFEALAPP